MNQPLEEQPLSRYIPAPSDDPLQAILSTLQCQNRLLLDLLAAVNGLTAAYLACRETR